MKLKIVIVFLFILSSLTSGQKSINISGYITDAISGENLSGANILLLKDTLSSIPFRNTSTNTHGFYVLPKLDTGSYFILTRYIGYKTNIQALNVKNDTRVSVKLMPVDRKEVVITGKKENVNNISSIDISPELISKLPTLSGEADLFKILQMLPGVKAPSELSSGLYIRGGSPDQNLTLVDGMNIYNPSHIGNIASTFNSGAIQDMRLIKGAFPSEYGGRISGILDVKLRSGTKEKEKGVIGLGLINSFFTVEGPVSNNSTYMVSGRGMYYDRFQENAKANSTVPRYNFYDLNGKLTYVLSDINTFSISSLYSTDNVYSPPVKDMNYDIRWENFNLGINWFHINSRSLFLTTVFNYTDYKFRSLIQSGLSAVNPFTYFTSSELQDLTLKQSMEYNWNERTVIKTGFELTGHSYNLLYDDEFNSLIEDDPYAGKDMFSIESVAYLNTETKLTELLNLNAGARFYYFDDNKYFNAEPRIALAYSLTDNTFLKAAYAHTHQFLHLLSRNDITLPTDLWYPSAAKMAPSKAIHYVASVDQYFFEQQYLLSCETYYKKMDNLYEFVQSPKFNPVDKSIEDQFTKGIGEAYGVELFFNKKAGDITGWIGYALSWTKRRFDHLNNGQLFYPRYDRRHDISVVAAYDINEQWNAAITWVYSTGQRFTLPPGQYRFNNISPFPGSNIYLNYQQLNNSEFPAFHKLDLNVRYSFELFKLSFQAYVNIYNVYNRQNAFAQYVTYEKNSNGVSSAKIRRLVLFPFLPTVGFSFKF